jgi:hypothetical protein
VLGTISGSTGAQDVFTAHRGFDLVPPPQSEAMDVEPIAHSAHIGPGFAAKTGMRDPETRLRLGVLACSLGALGLDVPAPGSSGERQPHAGWPS